MPRFGRDRWATADSRGSIAPRRIRIEPLAVPDDPANLDLVAVGINFFAEDFGFDRSIFGFSDVKFLQEIATSLVQIKQLTHPVDHEIIAIGAFVLYGFVVWIRASRTGRPDDEPVDAGSAAAN